VKIREAVASCAEVVAAEEDVGNAWVGEVDVDTAV